MKTLKKVVTWSLVALLLQSALFFMVDKYYEKTLMNTKVTEVRVYKDSKPQKNIAINIPLDAEKIEASFDGKYISYYENSELTSINTYDGSKHTINAGNNSKLVYSKWLPATNNMILCEQNLNSRRNITFFTYDAENSNKVTPTDTNNHNIILTLNNSTDKISNVVLPSSIGIMYIKVMKSNGKNDIFYNDANGKTTTLLSSKNIGNVGAFENKSNLIYDDITNNTVRITNSTWKINNKQTCLLNTDDSDNLYIGVLENGRVRKILYGSIDATIDKLTSLTFKETENKINISITRNGKVYVNNSVKGYVTENATNKKISYKGKLLKITDKAILSLLSGKLLEVNLN